MTRLLSFTKVFKRFRVILLLWRLVLCLLLSSMLFSIASMATPVSLETRYGAIEGTADISSKDRFVVSYGGKEVVALNGLDVTFYLVTQKGTTEYVIIDILLPGLYCRHEYRILEISPIGETSLSKPFGKCAELVDAKYLDDGLIVEIRKVRVEKKKEVVEKYKWTKGALTKGAK